MRLNWRREGRERFHVEAAFGSRVGDEGEAEDPRRGRGCSVRYSRSLPIERKPSLILTRKAATKGARGAGVFCRARRDWWRARGSAARGAGPSRSRVAACDGASVDEVRQVGAGLGEGAEAGVGQQVQEADERRWRDLRAGWARDGATAGVIGEGGGTAGTIGEVSAGVAGGGELRCAVKRRQKR